MVASIANMGLALVGVVGLVAVSYMYSSVSRRSRRSVSIDRTCIGGVGLVGLWLSAVLEIIVADMMIMMMTMCGRPNARHVVVCCTQSPGQACSFLR